MPKYTRFVLFAVAAYLILSIFTNNRSPESTDDVVLSTDTKIAIGKVVSVDIINNAQEPIAFEYDCVNNPLEVQRYENGEWALQTAEAEILDCEPGEITITANENYTLSYAPWNFELFDEKGRYRIDMSVEFDEAEKVYSAEIEVKSRSIFGAFWQEAFYKPILNTLIFFLSVIPGHSLAWAVILLTLLIKLILLAPNQKALKAQRRMQKVQPQLDALKKKYEKDPQQLAAETMKIWKKHKVSPMSSCLPLLIQFPVLIGLFYVVRDGLDSINPQLLYSGLQAFDISSIDPNFFGLLDLTQVDPIVLPIIVAVLQFFQMKLSLGRTLKTQSSSAPGMPMMGKTMMYIMPVFIAFFAATLPAAVGFYWGTSTLFGIGQQWVVNRSKD